MHTYYIYWLVKTHPLPFPQFATAAACAAHNADVTAVAKLTEFNCVHVILFQLILGVTSVTRIL